MHGVPLSQNQDFIEFSVAQDSTNFEPSRTWYALLVTSGQERKACIWLKKRQFLPYWPRYLGAIKLNRHRKGIRWRSVIPGYLFLPIPATNSINCELIESAPAIRKVMRNGSNEPVTLPEHGKDGIARIRELEEVMNADPIAADQGIPFKAGQAIRIARISIEGKIKRIASKKKIVVEAMFFGAVREFELPVGEIEAV
jgi:transcription antitermination factor NusG